MKPCSLTCCCSTQPISSGLVNITYFADQNLTGLIAIAQQTQFSTLSLLGGLLVWLALPLGLAMMIFNRRGL